MDAVKHAHYTASPRMASLLTPKALLRHMVMPGAARVFVLGCFERRVTLWSQQHRALNLIYALHHEGLLPDGTRVAIVGGGAAGLTAAAAAEHKGYRTTLFERQAQLLHFLAGNHTRFIHPRIIDWPASLAEVEDAGLPLLNWQAAQAGAVANQLLDGFKLAAPRCRVFTNANVELLPLKKKDSTPQLTWNGKTEAFDIVILAVGFGLERTVPGQRLVSYWRDDSLHQPVLPGTSRSYLVSGCGDGGLIDLLRLCITDFRHESLVKELFADPGELADLTKKIEQIEKKLLEERPDQQGTFIKQRYQKLRIPATFAAKLESRLRNDTQVTLCGRNAQPFDARSSALNRFLAWRLLTLNHFQYKQGEVTRVDSVGTDFTVHFKGGDSLPFNHVVIRHGPDPAITQFQIVKRWGHVFAQRGVLDASREPMWPDGYYQPPKGRQPNWTVTEPNNPDIEGRAISRVFSTLGVPPSYTFVEPRSFGSLKNKLSSFGRGLIVDGPSGIGKTVTVKKALQELSEPYRTQLRTGTFEPDWQVVTRILDAELTGQHLAVDDIHSFPEPVIKRLTDAIVQIHNQGMEAKITIIDGGNQGKLLIDQYPQLRNRTDFHRVEKQEDEMIGQLVVAGQRASNLRFQRPEQIIDVARGSYFLAQQLCQTAANLHRITLAPKKIEYVPIQMERIIVELMAGMPTSYEQGVNEFAALDKNGPRPGACLLILFLIAHAANDELQLSEVEKRYVELKPTLTWLKDGPLADVANGSLKDLLLYNKPTGLLTLRDPRLGFYLRNLSWVILGRKVGLQVGIKPNGELVL